MKNILLSLFELHKNNLNVLSEVIKFYPDMILNIKTNNQFYK